MKDDEFSCAGVRISAPVPFPTASVTACTGGGATVPDPDGEAETMVHRNGAMSQSARVTIETEQVDLLCVTGTLDGEGLEALGGRLDALLDAGSRLLVADLSRVTGCDGKLFELLVRTNHLLACRDGWLRLVGLGSPVLDALDHAVSIP